MSSSPSGSTIGGLIVGVLIGFVAAAMMTALHGPTPETSFPTPPAPATARNVPTPAPANSPGTELDAARRELTIWKERAQTAEQRVRDLTVAPAAAPASTTPASDGTTTAANIPPASSPPTGTEHPPTEADLEDLFQEMLKAGAEFHGVSFEIDATFLERYDALGEKGPAFIGAHLLNGATATERLIAAIVFGKRGTPAASSYLADSLDRENDALVRRVVSSVIAHNQFESAMPAMERAMNHDADWGVRANAAYGLAKTGRRDAVDALTGYYESPETPAEYRMAVLGGLADVAAPSTAQVFRKILAEKNDMAYLMIALGAVAKMKDRNALDVVGNLIAHAEDPSVRDAAKKTYNAITGQEMYR